MYLKHVSHVFQCNYEMPEEVEWWLNPDLALRDTRQVPVVEKEKEESEFHFGLGFEIALQ